ncbi:hypothetical protein V2I01_18450 [Micromonospora sp. BRA006-A]|nr:hypothetical protein [Micromonospora sp. BRA006-A]
MTEPAIRAPRDDDDRVVDLSDDFVVLPEQTSDDTDRGWGERPGGNDDWLLAGVPALGLIASAAYHHGEAAALRQPDGPPGLFRRQRQVERRGTVDRPGGADHVEHQGAWRQQRGVGRTLGRHDEQVDPGTRSTAARAAGSASRIGTPTAPAGSAGCRRTATPSPRWPAGRGVVGRTAASAAPRRPAPAAPRRASPAAASGAGAARASGPDATSSRHPPPLPPAAGQPSDPQARPGLARAPPNARPCG